VGLQCGSERRVVAVWFQLPFPQVGTVKPISCCLGVNSLCHGLFRSRVLVPSFLFRRSHYFLSSLHTDSNLFGRGSVEGGSQC
jgi:hypothetical protein